MSALRTASPQQATATNTSNSHIIVKDLPEGLGEPKHMAFTKPEDMEEMQDELEYFDPPADGGQREGPGLPDGNPDGNGDPDNPSDPEDPNDNSQNNANPPNPAPDQGDQFLQVMERLAHGLETSVHNQSVPPAPIFHPDKIQAKEPNIFDGNCPQKLNDFLFQCRIYFNTNPHQFHTPTAKVIFTLPYLLGLARQWFQTLLDSEPDWDLIPWYTDWDLFIIELTNNFGALDAISEATEDLKSLMMASGTQISRYNVEFA
ncbi:hypothetical protein P691DRAFT_767163 [Macrolepiota fuliginosa MF-IS2]|uniref:Retrotransposon gag domain-containing protein n=1 Tax=Macrolepiota fuliginosa MF-IS2 TaxID=1400762 RepID=A0A9P5WXC7_9AGAR|nr:hypothetical protein P691DRAFT_767163 [Macrolepiota fuliginosa MF-IS2]